MHTGHFGNRKVANSSRLYSRFQMVYNQSAVTKVKIQLIGNLIVYLRCLYYMQATGVTCTLLFWLIPSIFSYVPILVLKLQLGKKVYIHYITRSLFWPVWHAVKNGKDYPIWHLFWYMYQFGILHLDSKTLEWEC